MFSPVQSATEGATVPDETPKPPPAAVVIRLAREAAGMTIPHSARLASISTARWSQVEAGRENRNGIVRPVTAKAGTLARMARAVGISAERLEREGERPDAAEILREIERQEPHLAAVPPLPGLPDSGDVADEVIALLLTAHPDREFLAKLWKLEQPRSERLDLLRGWLHRDDPEPGENRAAGPAS